MEDKSNTESESQLGRGLRNKKVSTRILEKNENGIKIFFHEIYWKLLFVLDK